MFVYALLQNHDHYASMCFSLSLSGFTKISNSQTACSDFSSLKLQQTCSWLCRALQNATAALHSTAVLSLIFCSVKGDQNQALRLCMFYFLFCYLLKHDLKVGMWLCRALQSLIFKDSSFSYFSAFTYKDDLTHKKLVKTGHVLLSSKIRDAEAMSVPRSSDITTVSLCCVVSLRLCSKSFQFSNHVLLSGSELWLRTIRSQLSWPDRKSPKYQHPVNMLCGFSSLGLLNITRHTLHILWVSLPPYVENVKWASWLLCLRSPDTAPKFLFSFTSSLVCLPSFSAFSSCQNQHIFRDMAVSALSKIYQESQEWCSDRSHFLYCHKYRSPSLKLWLLLSRLSGIASHCFLSGRTKTENRMSHVRFASVFVSVKTIRIWCWIQHLPFLTPQKCLSFCKKTYILWYNPGCCQYSTSFPYVVSFLAL